VKPRFFATPAAFRAWLEEHHTTESELLVGFRKKGSGRPSITWPESVDQALCFGWIDGVRRRIDDEAYTIRFTPRKPRSAFSEINIARVAELSKLGLMTAAGLAAFEARKGTARASYTKENKGITLAPEYEAELRKNAAAHRHFTAQPPWYRRAATFWVMSAKQETTRQRRLATLIEASSRGEPIKPLSYSPPPARAIPGGARPAARRR
jgi:uncharacterized protein YdeI (YjbR/CyaY-like superfamily)